MPSDRLGGADDPGPIRSEPGSLLEHVVVAVFGIDDEDRICYWGPGAQSLFGHGAASILARPAAALFPGPAPGAARAQS
ncbi:protein kinase, partial [Streptomyces sp. SID7760]|nr:protein kinase [Streptomyces sp. SID7760]